MKNDLFEQAKQAVAEKRGAESWIVMYAAYTGLSSHIGEDASFEMLDSAYQEAAELYGQWMSNEAVRADRATIRKTCLYSMQKLDKSGETEGYYWIFDGQKFQELPLPFPPKPE